MHQNTWGRMSQVWKRDVKRDDKVQSLHNIWGFQCGCQQICRWTMVVPLCMYSGFPTGRLEQKNKTSSYDVMRISHVVKGGNYKRRAGQNLRAVVTVICMFRYKAFGFVSKPQNLYLGCLGALRGGSINQNGHSYLFINMHASSPFWRTFS